MKLHVIDDKGNRIPVNEKIIEGFKDNINYVTAKINIINSKISIIDKKKENALFNTETESIIDKFDADISKINIDYISVENMIRHLEKQRNNVKSEVTEKTKSNYALISDLHKLISEYSKEMGVDEKFVSPSKDYIFTSDLLSLACL